MPGWVIEIITSHFLWGIVIGLIIAIIGAHVQANLQAKKNIQQQKLDMNNFCLDIINNIIQISEDIAEARRRSEVIHPDLLALINVEVMIFGRNREHSIRLNDDLRGKVRKYVTSVALRWADIGVHLSKFDQQMMLARNFQAAGDGQQADRTIEAANVPLAAAHKATDDLISTANKGAELIKELMAARE